MKKTRLDINRVFFELQDWRNDENLIASIKDCIDVQRKAAQGFLNNHYKANKNALQATSEDALQQILHGRKNIHGISKQPEISNVIAFGTRTLDDAVNSDDITHMREKVDALVEEKLRRTFLIQSSWGSRCSGHFWYPPGGYMGWHTNSESPGWRLYISHSDEPENSFFRYRQPESGQIITSMDSEWDVRMFFVSNDKPLWHTVYSNTNRFSLGYRLLPHYKLKTLIRKTKKMLHLG